MKKNFLKCLLKVIVFVVIFVVLMTSITTVMYYGTDKMSYQAMKGFYDEPEDTLDAVYIGSSNVLAFWNPMLAWEEYGIAVSTFASNSQPLTAAEYLIKEARKTQEDAVFVVNINTIDKEATLPRLHRIFDYSPFSFNKISGVKQIGNLYNLTIPEKLELIFPIIRFHSRWNELVSSDFKLELNGYNGAITNAKYLGVYENVTKSYVRTEKREELTEEVSTALNSLLDYCDKEKLKIVFVTVPQCKKEKVASQFNTINDTIKKRGYPVLDLIKKTDELGINTDKDYYNLEHTNIHGSAKFTYYISEYLVENYGFENKKGNEAYSSWDKGLEKYLKNVDHSIMDFQLSKDYSPKTLEAVENLKATATDESINIEWSKVKGADGYEIFEQKGTTGTWNSLGTTKELSFSDTNFESKTEYYYRVVPIVKEDGKTAYGDFSYEGVSVTSTKSS